MRDHPAPRLSSLPSMDSHPCLPRCSVCESLELTARSKGSSSSTWLLPSSGFVCSFSHPVSDGPCFLPYKIDDSMLAPLYVTIFPDPFNQGSAGDIPARYTLPGKDFFLHTARLIRKDRASRGLFPGPIDDWRVDASSTRYRRTREPQELR